LERLVAPEAEAAAGGTHYLLIRRSLADGELAFYPDFYHRAGFGRCVGR
jgi:hypothetical protein